MKLNVPIYRRYVRDLSIDTRMCLSDALDDIERLQKSTDYWCNKSTAQEKHIADLEADLAYYKEGYESNAGCLKRVVAVLGTNDAPWMLAQRANNRIEGLEEQVQLLADTCSKKHDQIKRLEKALIEERAKIREQLHQEEKL